MGMAASVPDGRRPDGSPPSPSLLSALLLGSDERKECLPKVYLYITIWNSTDFLLSFLPCLVSRIIK